MQTMVAAVAGLAGAALLAQAFGWLPRTLAESPAPVMAVVGGLLLIVAVQMIRPLTGTPGRVLRALAFSGFAALGCFALVEMRRRGALEFGWSFDGVRTLAVGSTVALLVVVAAWTWWLVLRPRE